MPKIETAFVRKNNIIYGIDNDGGLFVAQTFKSINKAKAWSRTEQKGNGGLGMGYIRVG